MRPALCEGAAVLMITSIPRTGRGLSEAPAVENSLSLPSPPLSFPLWPVTNVPGHQNPSVWGSGCQEAPNLAQPSAGSLQGEASLPRKASLW